MKLYNSIVPLKNMLDCTVFEDPRFQSSAKNAFLTAKRDSNIEDAFKSLRYKIWYALSREQRDQVIAASGVPCVGGYYDYNDNHLDTLLNKVLSDIYLTKIVC
jgi:hypothetical protein